MRAPVACLLVLSLVAGCLGGSPDPGSLLRVRLQATFNVSGDDWHSDSIVLDLAPIRVQGPSVPGISVQGSPGGTATLPAPEVNQTLRLRIHPEDVPAGYQAEWHVLHAGELLTFRAGLHQEVWFNVTRPGIHVATLSLLRGDVLHGGGARPLLFYVNPVWIVEGEVSVVRGPGPANVPGRTANSDRVTAQPQALPLHVGQLQASTQYRGAWPAAGKGTDVDLELVYPDAPYYRCSASGGATSTAPTPQHANESVHGPLTPNERFELRVGEVGSACTAATTKPYANPGPVPYELRVKFQFSAALWQS